MQEILRKKYNKYLQLKNNKFAVAIILTVTFAVKLTILAILNTNPVTFVAAATLLTCQSIKVYFNDVEQT